MSQKSHIKSLIERHNNKCHYCDREVNRILGHPLMATKDHIVPKSYGGANNLSNYVLACSTCNNKRGQQLWFCACDICDPLISRALTKQKFYNEIFAGMIEHHRPKVRKYNGVKWVVKYGHISKSFDTWAEAMSYVNESESVHGPWSKVEESEYVNGFRKHEG